MKKRVCQRFNIPGTVLFYKKRSWFFRKSAYTVDYFPVVDLSKGGSKFLCNQRLKPGTTVTVKIDIPGHDDPPEILASIRWIAKNPEKSYRYQTGISFNSYGSGRNENSPDLLKFFELLESNYA